MKRLVFTYFILLCSIQTFWLIKIVCHRRVQDDKSIPNTLSQTNSFFYEKLALSFILMRVRLLVIIVSLELEKQLCWSLDRNTYFDNILKSFTPNFNFCIATIIPNNFNIMSLIHQRDMGKHCLNILIFPLNFLKWYQLYRMSYFACFIKILFYTL